MSEPTKPEPKPDDLMRTSETETIQLTEEDLKRISGGAGIDIKGALKIK